MNELVVFNTRKQQGVAFQSMTELACQDAHARLLKHKAWFVKPVVHNMFAARACASFT